VIMTGVRGLALTRPFLFARAKPKPADFGRGIWTGTGLGLTSTVRSDIKALCLVQRLKTNKHAETSTQRHAPPCPAKTLQPARSLPKLNRTSCQIQ
jgi:hypothetical protein